MEMRNFLNSPVTVAATMELMRERPNPADRGLRGALYLPEVYQDVDNYQRTVTIMGRAMIANDVAPLATGRMKGRLRRMKVGGGLIDSAAHLHLDGEDIEALLALIRELRGDTVRANMAELTQFLQLLDTFLLEPLDQNRERKRWTLMGTGAAYYENSRQDDFTRPPVLDVFDGSQTTIVSTASGESIYGGVDADFIRDVDAALERARVANYPIQAIELNPVTVRQILSLPSTKKQLGMTSLSVSTGGNLSVNMETGQATLDALNSFMVSTNRPPIRVYDGRWFNQVEEDGDPSGPVGTVISRYYIPNGRVIFIPRASLLENPMNNPTVPIRIAPFDSGNTVGLHIIGRPTAQTGGPRVYVFGPHFHEGVHPNMDGDSVVAHMPFLHAPAGFQIVEYQGAPQE